MSVANNDIISNKESLTEEQIQKYVKKLRELVLGNERLRNFRSDDGYLLRFLHCQEFQVEDAFKRITGLCDLFLQYPDWFASSPPLDFKLKIERNAKAIIQKRDNCGRSIFVCKLGNLDLNESSLQEEAILDEIWFESVLDEPDTQRNGICVILDLSNYSIKLLKWFKPVSIKIAIAKQELYPIKEVVVHVVNTSSVLFLTKSMIWPIVPAKIKNGVYFHFKNWEALHQHINAEVLPPEYGGTGPHLDFNEFNQWLFNQNEKLKEKLCYDKLK